MCTPVKAVLFLDLDGTLLASGSILTHENRMLLQHLPAHGVLPILCTGRAPEEIEQLLGPDLATSYIASNGQAIRLNGQMIYEDTLPPEEVDRLVQLAHSRGDVLCFLTRQVAAASDVNEGMRVTCAQDNTPIPPVDPNFHKTNPVNALYLFTQTQARDAAYLKEFEGIFSLFRDGRHSVAVVRWGNSKGTGIRHTLQHLALPGVTTYAFGDNGNDLPMYDMVDVGVAMGNAIDAVKEKADYITDTNDNSGIRKALEHFGLWP